MLDITSLMTDEYKLAAEDILFSNENSRISKDARDY